MNFIFKIRCLHYSDIIFRTFFNRNHFLFLEILIFILLFLHLFYKKVSYIRKANYECAIVFEIRISQHPSL